MYFNKFLIEIDIRIMLSISEYLLFIISEFYLNVDLKNN